MRHFITYTCIFIFPILIILGTIEIVDRIRPNSYRYKYEWMMQHSSDVEMLILGNSHTYYGIRPQFMSCKAFNLANSSQGYREDFFLLQYFGNQCPKLKTIVIPIAYYSLFWVELENDVEWIRGRYYRLYMDCNIFENTTKYGFEISDINSAIKKFKTYSNQVECETLGSGIIKKKENMSIGAGHVKRHEEMSNINDTHNVETLCNIIRYCKKRNIQVILISTPCWSTYYENLNQHQLSKMYTLIDSIQDSYHIPYLNYLKDHRFNINDFADPQHLSPVGAEKFTKILSHDIEELKK